MENIIIHIGVLAAIGAFWNTVVILKRLDGISASLSSIYFNTKPPSKHDY